MRIAAEVVGLVVVLLAVTGMARKLNWPAPLCLIGAGVAASFVPGVPDYRLLPELVLVGLLPPLLYATALRTSLVDFRANRVPIALLSVGLVVVTTLGVGLVTWLVVPGLPLAAGFALGAVVAPPDAVSATAIARRVGMPRQIVRILEGESLVNDAAALVALRTAIAALAGSVALWQVGVTFLLAAGVGVLVGVVVGWFGALLRRRIDDPLSDTALSLVVPFVAYLPAVAVQGSGVLAVVLAGLLLGHEEPRVSSGPARLANLINWRTLQFLLENAVFLLIGLQLQDILGAVARSTLGTTRLIGICVAVFGAAVLVRMLWMGGFGLLRRMLRMPVWPWAHSAVIAWSGMRGVVTLAAAFILPAMTPHRAALVLAAFVVVAGTLLLQGTTLPVLVRWLRLRPPDPAQDALQEAELLHEMKHAGLRQLAEEDADDEVVQRLRDTVVERSDAAWERLGRRSSLSETPSERYGRLRRLMLEAERAELLAARHRGRVDHEVFRRVLTAVDIEESMLDRLSTDAGPASPDELRPVPGSAPSCAHLDSAPIRVDPDSAEGCSDCLAEGSTWVHLRICCSCGHVACCDSSPRRHASLHFQQSSHPVVRSFEPGESWRWCYLDQLLG